MHFNRAKEIFDSSETIGVTFKGDPVWIEELYSATQTALVSSGMFEEEQKTVSVADLEEVNYRDNNPST